MEIKEIKEQLKDMFRTVLNDKWITIHPHGEDSDDYRRLKLEDGETPKEAIDRVYKKEDKKEDKKLSNKEAHEKLNSLRDEMRKYEVAGTRTSDEYKQLKDEYQKTLDEWDTSQPNEDKKQSDTKDGGEDFEKETKSTKKDEDRHQKVKDLEDKAYKEFKTMYDNYIDKDGMEGWGGIPASRFDKAKEQFNKKYKDAFDKLESDRFVSFEDFAKRENKQAESKGEKEDTTDSPFGEDVEITEHDKKGYMLDSKNLKSYRKGDKFAIVDDWSHDDKDRYTVSFHDGKKTLDRKTYSTKRGMEKAIREHLQGGPNKETKALETKTDLNAAEAKYKEVLQRYNENDRKRWSSGLSSAEYYKAYDEAEKAKKELTTARREYAESIMANFEKSDNTYYEDKQNARRERYEELSEKASRESEQAHQAFRDKMSAIPMGQPILVGHHSEQRDRRYREKAWDTLGKAVKLSDKANYYEGKANSVGKAGISADDANAIAKLAQKYKSGVTSAEKRRIIDRVIDIHKNRQMAGDTSKQTDYSDLGFQVERNTDINRLQLKFDGKPEANIRSILKSNGFRWSPREGAWQRQLGGNSEGGLNRVIEQLKNVNNSLLEGLDEILSNDNLTPEEMTIINCINNILDPTVDNDKENDMSILEDLKKLITKVENGKESDMEKIENEKVDKRDIIRQIMAIAGKEEASEDVKTIAKLAEKLAYDKSEAGTADNKCKNEDDEKEVEKVKEEVKEDVENKCDKKANNSVDNSKVDYFSKLNEIYNAASQIKEETEYVSQADREKAAEDYFAK